MLGLDGNWYKHQCSTWHSPLNHGINCGRPNEQVVSQPFLFWFGFSSPPLNKFPSFLLSFPFFLLFIYLFIYFCFSSSLQSFSLSPSLVFLFQVPFSPLPPPLFSSYSIHLLTFPLVLLPLYSLPPFSPWVGENNGKIIIFYGHNKCRFKPLK